MKKNSEQVIEKMAAAAHALGWPEQVVDMTREQLQNITKMQIETLDRMMDVWEEQSKSPNPMTASPAMLAKLKSLPSFGAGNWPICCKSLFALVIKNFPSFRRDFRVKMWGTSSPNDKVADDLGNAIEGTRISGRRSDFLTAGKLAPGNLGLLQQYRHR